MAGAAMDPHQMRGLRRHAAGFAVGLATGAVLTVAGFSVAVIHEDIDKMRETLIYLTSALAVDTERNAKKIVTLEERIDDLEAQLAELASRAK
jgi:uncharacterized coiled-coil protein SlyX